MSNNQKIRTVIFFNNYFGDFFIKQRDKVRAKIVWTIDLIEELERVPETYLKYIENTDGLYEIRVQQGSDVFRIFCFLMMENWLYWLMDFKRKLKRLQNLKLKKH